jgi:hypothetical protein
MANLFQLLSNVKNKISNLGGAQGLTPYERLFGQQAPSSDDVEPNELLKGVDTSSPYYKESMGEEAPLVNITASQNPRVGGIFNDIVNGYRENRTTPISMNNFGDNNIDFNRTKGLSYRIGEGLGSVGRFIDSPLGRGVLTGAAVAALGGAPGEALAYGGTATALNQGNRGRDTLYRQQLAAEGIDTSNVRGYINDNTYKSMLAAKQMKDNAEYRNALLTSQQQAQQEAREDRKLQREMQLEQNKFNNYIQGQRVAQGWANLNDRQQARAEAKAAKQNADDFGDIQAQLDNFQKTFQSVNNPYRYRVFGGASEKLNTLTRDEANFNAQRTLLFNQIARKLGGEKGVLSDKDIARVEAALPKLTDTYEQKVAKMAAVYDLLSIKRGSANQAANNAMQVGNYTVEIE